MTDPSPDDLERRSRELFEDSVERLDARTRSRLNHARNVALNELKVGTTRRYWLGMPLGGLAAAVLVAVFLFSGREAGREPGARGGEVGMLPLDDLDIVADVDSFELILDVEFYSWLADESAGARNNSG